MENEKTQAELLKEKLFATHKNVYEVCDEREILKAYEYCGDYMKFLNDAKTERECVAEAVKKLDKTEEAAPVVEEVTLDLDDAIEIED